VEQPKIMHDIAQKRAQEAKDDIDNGVLHPDKRYCMVCYYAINFGIPHFRKEQPGNTYYYLPFTINLFGLVDILRSPKKLDCYAYREFTGKKRSKNAASLLMHNLHQHVILQQYSSAKRLSIIMDNCYGHKTTNNVLSLAAYLMEMKFFRSIFYVRGHSKNTCHRIFKQMKISFHKYQMHSYHIDFDVLNIQPNVKMINETE
jgi:hypothetical protein